MLKRFLIFLTALILLAACNGNGIDPARIDAIEGRLNVVEADLAAQEGEIGTLEDAVAAQSDEIAGLSFKVEDALNKADTAITNVKNLAYELQPSRETTVVTTFNGDAPHEGTFNFEEAYFIGNGAILSIRVHVGSSSAMNEELPVYFIPMEQPSGFVRDYKGVCLIDSEDRPWIDSMIAEWVREPGGQWAIQCKDEVEYPEVVIVTPHLLHKRWPWLARTGDKWFVSIPFDN